MKKIAAIILALLMLLSFGACKNDSADGRTTTARIETETTRGRNGQVQSPSAGSGNSIETTTAGEMVRGVTFSEGRTIAWMAMNLEKLGVCDRASLLKAAKTMDLSAYSVAAGAGTKSGCAFKLEGYAYPATYDFYKNMKAEDVWKIFLDATQTYITEEDHARAKALGYSMNDVLTIASILQKEVKEKDMKMAASVIYNRLKKGMQLQMDSTINYVEGALVGFTTVTNATRSAYNTYKCAALPASPICNPGRAALNAALYPAESKNLYFCTNADESKCLFAETLEQHYKNCDTLGIGRKEGT